MGLYCPKYKQISALLQQPTPGQKKIQTLRDRFQPEVLAHINKFTEIEFNNFVATLYDDKNEFLKA